MTETTQSLGHLCEVQNDHFVARLNPDLPAGGSNEDASRIGEYLMVCDGELEILALVTSAASDPQGGGISVQLLPLGARGEDGRFLRGLRRFPVPGAEIRPVAEDVREGMFEHYREMGFDLGHLSQMPDNRLFLDPNPLFGRHLAILGQSGSGKSWTVASLLQRAVKAMPDAHIVLLDLHGEYCWRNPDNGKLQAAFDPEVVRYVDARDLEMPYWLLTYSELVDLLIDRTDPGASTQIAYMREVLLSLRRKANEDLHIERLSVDSPVFFPLQEMYAHFKRANEQQLDFGKTKGPLFGQFDEFLVKLQSKLNDARYDFLFRPRRRTDSASLEGLLKDFVGLTEPKRQITIVDLSGVPSDVRPVVSAQLGRMAFEFNYWNPRRHEFPLLLVCEEAHSYIPRKEGSHYEGTRRSMERIAKEGRKYAVGLTVVSQRPHDLSETVLSQCSSYICMRLTNPDDQEYVRSLVPEGERDLVNILTSLGRGEALILGEASPLPARFQVAPPNPTPNSSDAEFHRHWSKGPETLDVADIVDRWRRQTR